MDNPEIELENYDAQAKRWPKDGHKHILAQYTKEYVVVYQAFKPVIAEYAVKHQRFGGSHYSTERTSWIKTNFLWMMYRSGWATKLNQERILAIFVKADGFDEILRNAFTAEKEKEMKIERHDVHVRLQWDPDHDPMGQNAPRRAIQLGLKPKILKQFNEDWISGIRDITDLVHLQHDFLSEQKMCDLRTPREMVYRPSDENICQQIF